MLVYVSSRPALMCLACQLTMDMIRYKHDHTLLCWSRSMGIGLLHTRVDTKDAIERKVIRDSFLLVTNICICMFSFSSRIE